MAPSQSWIRTFWITHGYAKDPGSQSTASYEGKLRKNKRNDDATEQGVTTVII
jgi:hypothetical protein